MSKQKNRATKEMNNAPARRADVDEVRYLYGRGLQREHALLARAFVRVPVPVDQDVQAVLAAHEAHRLLQAQCAHVDEVVHVGGDLRAPVRGAERAGRVRRRRRVREHLDALPVVVRELVQHEVRRRLHVEVGREEAHSDLGRQPARSARRRLVRPAPLPARARVRRRRGARPVRRDLLQSAPPLLRGVALRQEQLQRGRQRVCQHHVRVLEEPVAGAAHEVLRKHALQPHEHRRVVRPLAHPRAEVYHVSEGLG